MVTSCLTNQHNQSSCYPATVCSRRSFLDTAIHISARPRATKQGCAKCRRLPSPLSRSNHREKYRRKTENKYCEILSGPGFQIFVFSIFPLTKQQCNLTVHQRAVQTAPKFDLKLSSVKVNLGENVSLRVKACGNPMPNLTWLKVNIMQKNHL